MGHLITIEGGEFTGKSSVVVPGVEKVLRDNGLTVLVSREPGGTKSGELIRETIFQRLKDGASSEELALLFNQSRQIHLHEIIYPFFEKNPDGIVVLDRYVDSTIIYQGLEGNVDLDYLFELHEHYADNIYPDLTLLLYFPENVFVNTLTTRKKGISSLDKRSETEWDKGDFNSHLMRQRRYLELPNLFKKRCIKRKFALVDASSSRPEVVVAGIKKLQEYFI